MPVYMIRAGESGPVKIGYSTDPDRRFIEFQVGHYEKLILIRLLEGGEPEEASLHLMFADLHLRGEWHSFSRRMLGDVGLTDIPLIAEPELEETEAEAEIITILGEGVPTALEIGQRLRRLRKRRGLRQEAVAKVMGVNRTTLVGMEQGLHYPGLPALLRASVLFGVPLTLDPAEEAA